MTITASHSRTLKDSASRSRSPTTVTVPYLPGIRRSHQPAPFRGWPACASSARTPETSERFLAETLMFTRSDEGFEARGPTRRSFVAYDELASPGRGGAGTVDHVAWTSEDQDIEAWQRRIAAVAAPTPVLERFYFRCVYFREPSDALFEIATRGPGRDRRRAARDPWRCVVAATHARASKERDRGDAEADLEPSQRLGR